MLRAVLINATDAIGHHGCTLVNRQIEDLAESNNIRIVERIPLGVDYADLSDRDLDCIIVNGEGTLHSDSKGAKAIAKVPEFADELQRPAFLINSIYQDNSSEVATGVKRFRKIWVRDKYSALQLEEECVQAEYFPDVTLSWFPKLEKASGDQLIVQDSTLEQRRQDLYRLTSFLKARYLPLIAQPSKNVRGGNWQRRAKYTFRQRFPFLLPTAEARTRYRNSVEDFDDFVGELMKASMIVTGRFHGIALALCLRIPFIAVSSNSRKVEALLEELGMMHRLAGNTNEVGRLISESKISTWSDQELQSILEVQKRTREATSSMFSEIAAISKT